MALFKPFRGSRAALEATDLHDGYAYFCIDDGTFHIDYTDENGDLHRKQLNAADADTLAGVSLDKIMSLDNRFVIDFSLPLQINVSDFDPWDRVLDGGTATYGTVTVNEDGKSFIYTPTAILQDIDNVELIFSDDSTTTVQIIPATTMYYEEDFVTFSDSSAATENIGVWSQVGTKTTGVYQKTSRPKPLSDCCVNDVYGYDDAYAEFTEYSLGSAMKVTVDSTTGGTIDAAPTASFTFTGTGFDLVSLTSNTSGMITVILDNDGNYKNGYVDAKSVDNYYGYKHYDYYAAHYTYSNNKWALDEETPYDDLSEQEYVDAIADLTENADGTYTDRSVSGKRTVYGTDGWFVDKEATDTIYQVPVMKMDGLDYGTYTVTVYVFYLPSSDHQDAGECSFWLDAIRIYNSINDNSIAEDVYGMDCESNPTFIDLRSKFKETYKDTAGTKTSAVWLGLENNQYNLIKADTRTVGAFYLSPGDVMAFEINETGRNPRVQCGLQLFSSVDGNSASFAFVDAYDNASHTSHCNTQTLSTYTEMFYNVDIVKKGRKSYVIMKNTSPVNKVVLGTAKLFDCEFITQADQTAVDAFVADIIAIANGTMQVQADWDQTDPSAPSFIVNKPEIATNEEIIEMLMEIDMIPVVVDSDGSALADENNNVLLW